MPTIAAIETGPVTLVITDTVGNDAITVPVENAQVITVDQAEYIACVVQQEVGGMDNLTQAQQMELFKAAALAARSWYIHHAAYGWAHMGKAPACNRSHCQRYDAGTATDATRAAAAWAMQHRLLYDGKWINALYGAHCDHGKTVSNAKAFGSPEIPYLKSVACHASGQHAANGVSGHGVGMCQWGAWWFARDGWTAEQILERFYPGVQVVAATPPDAQNGLAIRELVLSAYTDLTDAKSKLDIALARWDAEKDG